MKKLYIFFIAALSIALVSCQKELLEGVPSGEESLRTFTVSFEESTKTDITNQGKTVWKTGDAIWISNGQECDTLTVASAFDRLKYCDFTTSLQGKLYVVYPCSAACGVTPEGKIILNVPSIQNGEFGSANISATVVNDGETKVNMKNVTTVLKFKIPVDVPKPIQIVSINTSDNKAAGTFSVDFASGAPVVSTADTVSYSTDVTVKVDQQSGNMYATVIPGTYGAGLTMTAVTFDLKNAYQIKTTTSAKKLEVNELYDLGRIGDELQALKGEGTAADPWQIGSFPEMLAFAYHVNGGDSMRDQYIKLTADISTVTTPVGVYNGEDEINFPFQGNFDGNDKTVTVNLNGSDKPVGLFAYLADSAYVHNVKIAGKVSTTGSVAGALAGYVYSATPVTIENCSSSAVMSGGSVVGGLIGKSNGKANKNINKCAFTGTVEAKHTAGGIIAYGYYAVMKNCSNSGSIATTETNGGAYSYNSSSSGNFGADYTRGTGGIAGWSQNGSIEACSNSGNIKAFNKGGGIVGSAYWTNIISGSNSGVVESSDYGVIGGVVGWIMTSGKVYSCTNTGEIKGSGNASWIGGIAGYSSPQVGVYYPITFASCENKGKVYSPEKGCVGGIIGYAVAVTNAGGAASANRTELKSCVNYGEIGSGSGDSVGGVVGYFYDCGSYTSTPVDGCLNSGSITGSGFVGGIIGQYKGRGNGLLVNVNNCENSGVICSIKKGDNDYVGGIVGGCINTTSTNKNNPYGVNIKNSNNTGAVMYAEATHKAPYAGGIYGGIHWTLCGLYNCYNGGKVGLKEGEMDPEAEGYIGAIVGLDKSGENRFTNCYALEGTASNIAGTASTNKGASVSFVGADGTLTTPVTYKEVQYENVIDALNAYASTNTSFYQWTTGPKLVQPSYTDPVDGGGFDIGNGGQI